MSAQSAHTTLPAATVKAYIDGDMPFEEFERACEQALAEACDRHYGLDALLLRYDVNPGVPWSYEALSADPALEERILTAYCKVLGLE